MRRFSLTSLLSESLRGHQGWGRQWRDPQPKAAYDVVIALDFDWTRLGAERLRLLERWVDRRGGGLVLVAEDAGEPVGFLFALPDYNEAFRHLRGSLVSRGLLRALPYFLNWRTPRYLRCLTLGVIAKHRGRGIEAAMLASALTASLRLGFIRGEASWILEDNIAVQRTIGLFGGEVYKRYRVYERAV